MELKMSWPDKTGNHPAGGHSSGPKNVQSLVHVLLAQGAVAKPFVVQLCAHKISPALDMQMRMI